MMAISCRYSALGAPQALAKERERRAALVRARERSTLVLYEQPIADAREIERRGEES